MKIMRYVFFILVLLYHLVWVQSGVLVRSLSQGRQRGPVFTLDSLLEATLPALQPFVAAGSTKCEYLKNVFGVTYNQMQENKALNAYESVSIDMITPDGNIKFNMTESFRRLAGVNKLIVILIHGFMESSNGIMVQHVAPEFIKRGDTVFALDGSNAISFEYLRSSTYVRFLGEKLGNILTELINDGQAASTVMLVGHSLGAHIAGIAGKQVLKLTGQLLGRITALDPAGPCFTTGDPDGRLDRDDAQYVDVIHTSAGILGINEPIGHKDFYPNGGVTQPGCILATCDHSRVWQLYAESINSPDHFPARQCNSWSLYREGRCSENPVAFLGEKSVDGEPGSYFLTTRGSAPYGLGVVGAF